MMIKRVSFLGFLLVRFCLSAKESELPEHERYINQIVFPFAASITKELDLSFDGEGGSMPHDVEGINLMFSAQRRATIEEARKLQVYVAEKLLKTINAHEKIRPFLREYPFPPTRICIRITFDNKSNRYQDGTITYSLLVKGKIHYCSSDLIKNDFVDEYEEPYAEALKIVQSAPLTVQELRKHTPNPYEEHMDQLFLDFAKEVRKKWGVRYDNGGGKWVNGIEEVAIKFYGAKSTPVEKAREIHVAIRERLCEIINADVVIRPYLKEYPFPMSRIHNCTHFYRKPAYRWYYEDGSVAYVEQDKDKVLYFTEQPWIGNRKAVRPVPLAQESYETAKKLVQKK